MSQVNLPNGIPPHLNGVDSSHSSRDSSPSARMYQHQHIPAPSTGPIPQSQLPPVRQLAHNFANLQVKQQTPMSSPKAFSTSTPTQNESKPANMGSTAVSPIGFSNVPLSSSNDPQAQLASRNTNVPSRMNSLPHQNSLPTPAAGVGARPQIQPSLSQPRLMGYNQNAGSQGSSVNASPARQVYGNPQSQGDGGIVTKAPPAPVNGAQAPYAQGDFRYNNNQPQIRPVINKGMPPAVPPQVGYQYPQTGVNKANVQEPVQMGYQYPQPAPMPPVQTNAPDNHVRTNLHANRYPTQQFNTNPIQQQQQQQPYTNTQPYQQYQQQQQPNYMQKQPQTQFGNQNAYNYSQPSVPQMGFNKLWGTESYDLLQTPVILPRNKVETPRVTLGNELLDAANCHPDIFRCTMTKIPESNSLLQKSRLPLGVLIHPFRDLNQLPVIQCNTIVRCRSCRTYINPFVFFVDNKRWKCNLCYRVNELPEEFQYDPVTKTYGDPSRRPEVKASTIEYIAPAEYMLRPPQPAVYLFLLDVSRAAIESGYLATACNVLSAELSNLPGDARTHIGFIAYNSALHFYSLADGLSQPHEMTVLDVDDVFLPCPDNLLVNLQDRMELVSDLLAQLPSRYNTSYDTGSALGAALQAAHKMMASTGGRVTVFQAALPSIGPGMLTAREDPSQRAGTEAQHLNPANDFYKRLALECSGQQIAVDLFLVNSQYIDIATISGISRFSGGCIHHFPLFKAARVLQNETFERSIRRYLTRKIGFEAVMRIRCSRGLSIHTFHGNFFVRSTDLLSLPNVNPDAGFGMQVAIEENLSDVQTVCFQAALLYTSSKGERRIRVHTMCLPVTNNISDIINSADQQCIIGLLSKMAVDRSMQSNLSDAREAFINVAIDILSSYKLIQNLGSGGSALMAPNCLRLLPLYISALLKNVAFRTGISTRLDDRVKAMCDMKTRPLSYLIQQIYPDLYPVHNLQEQSTVLNEEEEPVPNPPRLQLTARSIDSNGAYLLDTGEHMILLVCPAVSQTFLNQALGVPDYNSITDQMFELPVLQNEHNHRLHVFINYLNYEKPMNATLQIMRDNSQLRVAFLERLIEDRIETALSYHEFLQHLKAQIK